MNSSSTSTPEEWSRRSFLKLLGLGALSAAWTLPSCRSASRYIVPYKQAPEWALPGKPTYYTTVYPAPSGIAYPLLATSHEGRPTMLTTNETHPDQLGCPPYAIASLWDLYSPDRSKLPLKNGQPISTQHTTKPAEFQAAFTQWAKLTQKQGKVAFLLPSYSSPTIDRLLAQLKKKNPGITLYQDNNLSPSSQIHTPHKSSFVDFTKTKRIFSLSCDFLAYDIQGRLPDFFAHRNADAPLEEQNRLYVIESAPTLTGGYADHKLSVLPQCLPIVLLKLAQSIANKLNHRLLKQSLESLSPEHISLLQSPEDPTETHSKPSFSTWIDICTDDLCSHKGNSWICADTSLLPKELIPLISLLNQALQAPEWVFEKASLPTVSDLYQALRENKHDLVFFLSDQNLIYTQNHLDWKSLLSSEKLTSIHLGLYADAMAQTCTWHIPAHHYLESWNDLRTLSGLVSIGQPLIYPLYFGLSPLELIMGMISAQGQIPESSPNILSPVYSAIKSTFSQLTPKASQDKDWLHALTQGYVPQSQYKKGELTSEKVNLSSWVPSAHTKTHSKNQALTLLFITDYALADGRFINNAWLQESPNPIAKSVWENVALISATLSKKYALIPEKGSLKIAHNGNEITLPFEIIPGLPDNLVILPKGYGQTITGIVGAERGTDTALVSHGATYIVSTPEAPISLSHESTPPILTQKYGLISKDQKNAIDTPNHEEIPPPSGIDRLHQWGMCIDLNKCIGCNACVLACLAENNIPIVGPEQCRQQRIMHWLRINRSFTHSGVLDFEPLACQQCEQAPCESVCPTAATVHTNDGLNAMAYPRCVGTRYCATNCPYKVRRFNYFDYNKNNPFLEKNLLLGPFAEKQSGYAPHLQKNPNVTVRMRGIMEKCTYCVQRIEAAKIAHKAIVKERAVAQGRLSTEISLEDNDIQLPPHAVQCACQQACPSGAISFGNLLNNKESHILSLRQSPRAYALLGQLHTQPRTIYLERKRNYNPKLLTI